jgi:hypothetical protein
MMKPANTITDRAKRYRAQRNKPAGPRRCNFCTSRRNVDIDHITGDESEGEPENLIYLCRVCNTRKAINQKRHRIGVRTRQYNPMRPTFARYRNAALILTGLESGDVAEATAYIRDTPPAKRLEFAEVLEEGNPFRSEAQRRKFFAMASRGEISRSTLDRWMKHYGPTVNPEEVPSFKQYAFGVSTHVRGAHDEGGKIIHATPPATRTEYAERIAAIKRSRRGTVPF